ncbi:MAG: DUF6261 family protein [Bacteroidales bacterium]|jgi:hypothetical protein|nr:DUF6261 family protein [Bacteroidales bacterium]
MLKKINKESYNSELSSQFNAIANAFKDTDLSPDPILKRELAEFSNKLPPFDEANGTVRVNKYTNDLINADKDNDSAFISFKSAVKANSTINDPEIADKAEELELLINGTGKDIHRLSYDIQYSSMGKLIKKMQEQEYAAIIDDLGLRVLANILIKRYNKFATVFEDSKSVNSDIKSVVSATNQRKDIIDLYNNKIVTYINSFISDNRYSSEVKDINSYIDSVNQRIKSRTTRRSE